MSVSAPQPAVSVDDPAADSPMPSPARRRAPKPGTARAAFSHRNFRTIYLGAFATNIGTWMQNVVLGAFVWEFTRSQVFVGVMMAAQLGPMLLLSMVGGMIADTFDRRRSLILLSLQQAFFSLMIGIVALPAEPNRWLLAAMVMGVGIGNALYAPIFAAVVPILVPRRDITGAIALNSVQMNASRVIGPIIGAFIYARWAPSWVFFLNALFPSMVIYALTRTELPDPIPSDVRGLRRIVDGIGIARNDRVVRRSLVTVFVYSLFSLPFITQMPAIAGTHLGIDSDTTAYGFLYACFGLGAITGALLVGSVFSATSKSTLTRVCLVLFAVLLSIFGALRVPGPAYVVIIALGCVYFMVITSLSTALQQDLDDGVRGKVMALWMMGFGGTVPFGGLLGGVLMSRFGIVPVILGGAVIAVGLAAYANLEPEHEPALSEATLSAVSG